MEKPNKSSSAFHLHDTGAVFESKAKDIFSVLDTIEAKNDAFNKVQAKSKIDEGDGNVDDVTDTQNEDSQFKVPVGKPLKQKTKPASAESHFIKYDLSTTGLHTEKQNTSAAFDFLNDLKKQKDCDKQDESEVSSSIESVSSTTQDTHRHTFKKPTGQVKEKQEATYKGGILTMPEYTVGESKQKIKEVHKHSKEEAKQDDTVSLSHLEDVDQMGDDNDENSDSIAKTSSDKISVQFKKFHRKGKQRKRETEDEED